MERPGVGIGIIIENSAGEVLIGRRIGSHAQKYSIPGGAVKLGETFEEAATREALEEHDITVIEPRVIAVTNNLETFREDGVHFISIILHARRFKGEPKIMEPAKCRKILWCNPRMLPEPHFDASRFAIRCFLQNEHYLGAS